MAKPKLPVFGQPIWIISENLLSDKVQIAGESGYFNALMYFAADAVLVREISYDDNFPGDLTKVVINKGMKSEKDPAKSLEFRVDLSKDTKDQSSVSYFTDEEEAQATARRMNENQKKNCKKILDAATRLYHEYDEIIASCTARPTTK